MCRGTICNNICDVLKYKIVTELWQTFVDVEKLLSSAKVTAKSLWKQSHYNLKHTPNHALICPFKDLAAVDERVPG